jgi:hypothetical protein
MRAWAVAVLLASGCALNVGGGRVPPPCSSYKSAIDADKLLAFTSGLAAIVGGIMAMTGSRTGEPTWLIGLVILVPAGTISGLFVVSAIHGTRRMNDGSSCRA